MSDNFSALFSQPGPVSVVNNGKTFRITLDKPIGAPDEMREEIMAIRDAGPNDVVELYLSGPGGDASTLMIMLSELSMTPAHTVAIIQGSNASANTFIPMVCREIRVAPYSSFMIHTVQYNSSRSTVANIAVAAKFDSELFHEFLRDLYEGFLSEEEIDGIIAGKEIYLRDTQIAERWENRIKLLKEEALEEEASLDLQIKALQEVVATAETAIPVMENASETKPKKKAKGKV